MNKFEELQKLSNDTSLRIKRNIDFHVMWRPTEEQQKELDALGTRINDRRTREGKLFKKIHAEALQEYLNPRE